MTRPRFLYACDESTSEPVEIKRWWVTGFNDAQVQDVLLERGGFVGLAGKKG